MPKYSEKVQRGIYKRIVGALSGLAEIDVQVHPNESPHYKSVDKVVVMPTSISFAENESEDFELGRGVCLHEGSHVLFLPRQYHKTATRIEQAEGKESAQDYVEWLNVFADLNNEYKLAQVFPHLKPHLARKTAKLFEKHPDGLKSDNPFMQVLIRSDRLVDLKAEYPDNYPDELQKFVEDTVKRFNKQKIHSAKGSQLLKFTQDVWESWKKTKKACQQPPQGLGELMKALAKAIEKGDEKAEADINDKIDKANKPRWFKDEVDRAILRPANGEGKLSEMTVEEIKDLLKKNKDQITVKGKQGAPPLDNEIERIHPDSLCNGEHYRIDLDDAYKEGKQINRQLRKKVKLQEDYEKQHRNGMVDMDEIRKQIGAIGRIYKPTIFQRRNTYSRGGAWAVSMLVDCSASMSGLMSQAKQAMATLAYALDGLPNVHYEIIGYSSKSHTIEIPVKEYGENRFKMNKLKKLEPIGGTPTSNVMNSSMRRMMRYRGLKRLMIVITDGMPANQEATAKASRRAEQLGIRVIGIGLDIGEGALKRLFPTVYCFHQHKDLDKDITNLILTALHSRKAARLVKRAWE